MVNNTVWQITNEPIINPESVYYSQEADAIFVANVVGSETEKDGQGWLSKISLQGELIEAKWVEDLNAPHGMRSYQGKLWVADINEVVVIDLESGIIEAKIPIPDAQFLNDIAITDDGKVFVSDTVTNRIHLIEEGEVTTFAEGPELESPNGLFIKDNELFVAGWGNIINPDTFETDVLGNVFKINLTSNQKQTITEEPLGNLDGIEEDANGNFIVTDFNQGKLFVIDPTQGETYEFIADLGQSADLAYIDDQGIVIIPSFDRNTITAYQYHPTLSLNQQNQKLLEMNGDVKQAKLHFRLEEKDVETHTIIEVGIFAVDDAQGRINNLLPGEDGYTEAALARSNTIFSTIADDFFSNPSRTISNFDSQFLSFYLIQGATTDQVLQDPSIQNQVLFNSTNSGLIEINTLNNNRFQLNFEDGLKDSNTDLTLTVELTNENVPIGTELQGQEERELLDLRSLTGQEVEVSFPIIESEADYQNTVGFYQVKNETGTVIDPLTGLEINPGEAGYAQAALRNSQELGISFQDSSTNFSSTWQGGYIYAPYLIANQTLEETLVFLETNNTSNVPVYFVYGEANWDGFDHITLLGDNTWGFEDLASGGDSDYNDIVIQASL